jgi:NADH dehydrogenase [ubiquinone] 1 alpha subcomplex assembly factor 5
MIQAQHLLKPDGIFLAVMLGGDSLYELRNALALAEQERDGALSRFTRFTIYVLCACLGAGNRRKETSRSVLPPTAAMPACVSTSQSAGGISPRVSPQISTDDAGSLLTRAGFKLLTVDTDQIVVPYPDALTLMHELR